MTRSQLLTLAMPSKGRLMEETLQAFARAGIPIEKVGHARGYRGRVAGRSDIEVLFLSAGEIAVALGQGRIHLGVTGHDLIAEQGPAVECKVALEQPLGIGHADVIVAVPTCWLDVERVADIEDAAVTFREVHGRRLKVATKYKHLARSFLARHGVTGCLIVESLGATEGTPASGTADFIVDITSTGETLKANHLKIPEDGLILKSQAYLMAADTALWTASLLKLRAQIVSKLGEIPA